MLPLNHDALRAALTTNFSFLSRGITGASQILSVCDELSNATKNILCDIASDWNYAHNALRRMPVEMLAMCFASLDLRDAIAVSQVSRSWREIALSHPTLWTCIDLSDLSGDIPMLLKMLSFRTGQHAVDFFGPLDLAASAVSPAVSFLAQHMSRLRTLIWGLQELSLPFSCPAPLLEELRAPNCDLVVPPDFLGGEVGRLRTLQVSTICFPQTCPALSTLSHLFLEFLSTNAMALEHAASLKRMFELCPRLRSLSLLYMTLEDAEFLPVTPAPRSLAYVELSTIDLHYDLIGHYIDWKSGDNLNEVRLEMDKSSLPECRLQEFVAGATGLVVIKSGTEMTVVTTGPGESKRTVAFDCDAPPDDDYSALVALLLNADSVLTCVESLGIPSGAVDGFVNSAVFTRALPKLKLLTVAIDDPPRFGAGWDSVVDLLRRAAGACASLRAIGLDFMSYAVLPTAHVARELLAAFERSAPTLPDVCIVGFASDAVRDMQMRKIDGCHIEFDAWPEDTDSETEMQCDSESTV